MEEKPRNLDHSSGVWSMKRSVMRILLAALCLFATSALNAQNLKEFAGTWRADPDKVQEKATPVKDPTGNAPDIPPPPPPEHKYTLEQIRLSGDILKARAVKLGQPPCTQSIPAVKRSPIRSQTPLQV